MRSGSTSPATLALLLTLIAGFGGTPLVVQADWPQWRGPHRDGRAADSVWPSSLGEQHLRPLWRVSLGPSYSGPIVTPQTVFVTESTNETTEAVLAFDRTTGTLRWRQEWEGYVKVPFFAKANGDWIRATPAYAEGRLYVAGMRDVLVAFEADTGRELWRVDFVEDHHQPIPAFGFVSSPLVVGDAVYVQAGAAFVKLDAASGRVIWRTLQDDGGMGAVRSVHRSPLASPASTNSSSRPAPPSPGFRPLTAGCYGNNRSRRSAA